MTPLLAHRSRVDRSFERLYRRHAADVYRYALAVLRNPADAEDVTQTTFLNAYRAFTAGERPQTPKNWLIAIAHNVCRQRFRQAARRPSEVELNEDLAEALVRDDPIAVDDIQRALGHLAFNQRAALVMRELEGRSYAEIAQMLQLSPSAVETLIFRARRAVREQLEGTLTCDDAELAISKQVDGELSRADKGQLRAHLRECKSCSTIARRMRAQRAAWKSLGAVPLPGSLTGLFGGSSASVATGLSAAGGGAVALKAASVVAVVTVAGGTAYEGKRLLVEQPAQHERPAVFDRTPVAAAPVVLRSAPTAAARPATGAQRARESPIRAARPWKHAFTDVERVKGAKLHIPRGVGRVRPPKTHKPPSPPSVDEPAAGSATPAAEPPAGARGASQTGSGRVAPKPAPPAQVKKDSSSASSSGKAAATGQDEKSAPPGQEDKPPKPDEPREATAPSPPPPSAPATDPANENGNGNGNGYGQANGGGNK